MNKYLLIVPQKVQRNIVFGDFNTRDRSCWSKIFGRSLAVTNNSEGSSSPHQPYTQWLCWAFYLKSLPELIVSMPATKKGKPIIVHAKT